MAAPVLVGLAYDVDPWTAPLGPGRLALLVVSQLTRRAIGGNELWAAIGGYLIA